MPRRFDRRQQRRPAFERRDEFGDPDAPVLGQAETSTSLHAARLDAVADVLLESGAQTVLDLGCGSGALMLRLLAERQFTRVVGVDDSPETLAVAARLLEAAVGESERWSLIRGSFAEAESAWRGFDAAALVETIEHVAPEQLSRVERAVFAEFHPPLVIVTTPNREYNPCLGLAEGTLRHADHRFEWPRAKFQAWATGVANRNGYRAEFEDLGPCDPALGGPTQMGVFRLK